MSKVDTSGPRLMTQAEYARHREANGLSGSTRQAVKLAVDGGRISTIGDDKLIDPVVADIQWEKNSRARATTRPASASNPAVAGSAHPAANDAPTAAASMPAAAPATSRTEYQDFRTRREAAEAQKSELELAKLSGRVIEAKPAEQAVYDAFHSLRDAVLAAPRRMAPACVGIHDVRELEHLQTTELRKVFEAWEARMLAVLEQRAA